MTEKEIAEIRRRFRPEKSNINRVVGCYVNEQREVISLFEQSLTMASQEEAENVMGLLKKSLSGGVGRNLLDITFTTAQVVDSEEHKLLMALRESALKEEGVIQTFCQRVIDSLRIEGKYLILLACETYDVPYRSKDGGSLPDASEEVFSYVICSICPVKETKPVLSYQAADNLLHNKDADWVVSPPAVGFLFPAFDDRSANIYGALYYTKDGAENHQEFVDAIFSTELPMPADEQKETFHTVLSQSLGADCSFDVVQGMTAQLCGMVEEHKANKEEEALVISGPAVRRVLSAYDVPEEKLEEFEKRYTQEFGEDTQLSPENLINRKQLEVATPEVSIKVSPEYSDMVETRVIDGRKYILIRVESGVEVNGVPIHIPMEKGENQGMEE